MHKQTLVIGMDDAMTRGLAAETAQTCPDVTCVGISIGHDPSNTVHVQNGQLIVNRQAVLDLRRLDRLRGTHNWQNVAAAYAACVALGLDHAAIAAGLHSFPGLAHRQQQVAMRGNVQFVNDSKATNADATARALVCFDPIYWIVGGQPKEGGLDGLEPYMPRIRHAFLIGEATEDFARWLDGKAAYTRCGTLENAVTLAANLAYQEDRPGATILLSPACASWDQFRNFEQRGDLFAELAKRLAA